MPTEREMVKQLRAGKVALGTLVFRFSKEEAAFGKTVHPDALLEVSWGKGKARFAVECKALSTPKIFQTELSRLKTLSLPQGFYPMLFVPFLNEQQLQELERDGISGIDLCGNGVVVVPEKYSLFRSGGKNRFTSSAPIKNIYRKNSSMVGRVFLLRSRYEAVQDICREINQRNWLVKKWDKKAMTLPTVSKVLKSLEQDLIISRENAISLLQADKLLEKLSANYTAPSIKGRILLKVSEGEGTITELLKKASQGTGVPFMASGLSSVGRYAVMQRGATLSVYCPDLDKLLDGLQGSQPDRFPNLELIETEDETVYFDGQQEGNFWWASPVQVYLELMSGDKRDQETAEQVKSFILSSIRSGTT